MKQKLSTNLMVAIVSIFATAIIGFLIAKTGVLAIAIIPFLIAAIMIAFYVFRNPQLGYLLIIFFLPFERIPTYNIGGTDIKINVLVGFLTIIAWILAILFNGKRWKVQPNALAIPIGLFIIALLLSLTQAVNMTRAIQVLVFSLFTISLSVLTANMLADKANLRQTVTVLFISGLFVGLFGLFQFAGDVIGLPMSITLLKEGYTSEVFGFPRVQAFSMEPLYFANYLLIPLCLLSSYFLGQIRIEQSEQNSVKSFWEKLIANPLFITALLALLLLNFVLTVSRGGYLGLAFSLLTFALFYYKKVFNWRNLFIVAVVGLVYWSVNFALAQGEVRASREFFGHVALNDLYQGESIQGRLYTFGLALRVYDRSPLVGIGIGNYGPKVKNYPTYTPDTGWDIVNNQYIELMAETGLIGIITFLSIFLVLILRSIASIRAAKDQFLKATIIGLFAALIGTMVQYNFFSTLYIIHIWVLIGLLVGAQTLALRKEI